jgi:hypothetical protein
MHYRNGREAKNGDKIVKLGGYGTSARIVVVGVLYGATPGNDFCNGYIAPFANDCEEWFQGGQLTSHGIPSFEPGSMTIHPTACMCDCLHVDDVAAMLAEKGLDKRPAGM